MEGHYIKMKLEQLLCLLAAHCCLQMGLIQADFPDEVINL